MSLQTRLLALEAFAPIATAVQSAAEQRFEAAFGRALNTVIENTPRAYAERAIGEFEAGLHWTEQSAITRRVEALAASAIPSGAGHACGFGDGCSCGWHFGHHGPLALPEAVCALLASGLELVFDYYSCELCGYQPGERPLAVWRAQGGPRCPFETCPLDGCGGRVSGRGWEVAYRYDMRRARRDRVDRDPAWAARYGLVAEDTDP